MRSAMVPRRGFSKSTVVPVFAVAGLANNRVFEPFTLSVLSFANVTVARVFLIVRDGVFINSVMGALIDQHKSS